MAVANLHETLINYKLRLNKINLDLTKLSNQKLLALYSQADLQSLKTAEEHSARDYCKGEYQKYLKQIDKSGERDLYGSYTEFDIDGDGESDFEATLELLTARFQDELDEIAVWETSIDEEISTESTEKTEVTQYISSVQQMLSSNISNDYKFGLDG